MSMNVHGTARAEVLVRLVDLSLGGALVVAAQPLEPGVIHDFVLDLEGVGVPIQAEVRHCRTHESGSFQAGIQFVGIDPHDQQLLRAYLVRRRAHS
jgi:c-di-GMP-binding flagellar brake protein YcgR